MLCWTYGVEDAGEITGGIVLWNVAFLICIHCCHVRFAFIEVIFDDYLVFVERLEPGYIAQRPPMMARDALNLHLARSPADKSTPVHQNSRHRRLDLVVVVVCSLELVSSGEISQMMMPLRGAFDLHVANRIRTLDNEDAHGTGA